MSEQHNKPNQDDPLVAPGLPWPKYIGIFLVGVMVFGLVTWLLGLGPFAYRQVLYGTSEVYILNMTDKPVDVTLDLGSPIRIDPEGYRRTPILGGTTTLRTRDASGNVLEEVDVFVDGAPVFYNVLGERCLVLADVSSFYLPAQENTIKVLKKIPKKVSVVNLPSERMIWPRETLRDEVKQAEKGVSWIEIVGCPLLEEDHLLTGHLNILLTERKKRQKEEEIRRKMMQKGGSEDVDKMTKPTAGFKVVEPDAGDVGSADVQ